MPCSALAKEGIRIRKDIILDQLEGFDQLEIGLDMICFDLVGPSLGGQESSLYRKRGDVLRSGAMKKEQTIQFPQILSLPPRRLCLAIFLAMVIPQPQMI